MPRGLNWLDTKTAKPEIDVSGIWNSPEWGAAEFEQAGNKVSGTLGDYPAKGVVSGNHLYLLMYSGNNIHYTADLKATRKGKLTGVYSKYTIIDEAIKDPGDRGMVRPINLIRLSDSK